jgi:hypothetical protein
MGYNEYGLERLFYSITGKHYRQGPYLSFLKVNAEAAIELICKLANFAANRQLESIERNGVNAVLSCVRSPMDQSTDWHGDEHSFNWNRGLLLACESMVPALAASSSRSATSPDRSILSK